MSFFTGGLHCRAREQFIFYGFQVKIREYGDLKLWNPRAISAERERETFLVFLPKLTCCCVLGTVPCALHI